ncbi:MAG: NAD-dependent epimerase/dehydratase family protein [Sandaracinus sp.]
MSEHVAVVIGGAGFVGRRLVALATAGERPEGWPRFDRVRVLDTAPLDPEVLRAAQVPVEPVIGDITRPADLAAVVAGAQTVFHLASVVDVSLRPAPRIEHVNVGGTRNVVEACLAAGVKRLVYTSSEDVLLSEHPVAWGDESYAYPTRPIHPYVATKIEGEKLARAADGKNGLRTVAIRPVHVYGPHDPHAIPTSLRAFAAGSVPFLVGHPKARFDVVYVDNVVHAHLLAAGALERAPERVGGKAYFVGEDNRPNYFEWLRPYAERKGIRMPRRYLGRVGTALAARAMEMGERLTGKPATFHTFHQRVIGADFFFSCAAIERDLGYRPIVTPDEGQRRTLAWIDTQTFA